MNIYIEHDARAVAQIGPHECPGCDGVVLKLGEPNVVLASSLRSNPLATGGWLIDLDCPGSRLLAWSGTLGETLFAAEPRNWMKPGIDAFSAFCDELAPQLIDHERTLCFQPHARHVLSDPQSSLRFLRDREHEPFEIALAPSAMLEPSMLDRVEDHLHRAFEALGAVCSMVVLHDVIVPDHPEGALQAVPLGSGIVPRGIVLDLLRQFVPIRTPVVLLPGSLEAQLAWLEAKSGP